MNFKEFSSTLTDFEKASLKSMLASKVQRFFNEKNLLSDKTLGDRTAFDELAESLRILTPFHEKIPANGVGYYGKPDWLGDGLLEALQHEARNRKDKTLDRIDHFLSCGGDLADRLSVQPEIVDFVANYVGSVKPTGIASYLYYDFEGGGIKPHVDTEVFSINMIIMLRHIVPNDAEPSSTVVFPAKAQPESFRLEIGEVMIMHGSSTIHTRTIIQKGEEVDLLTIGFNRVDG